VRKGELKAAKAILALFEDLVSCFSKAPSLVQTGPPFPVFAKCDLFYENHIFAAMTPQRGGRL